jgi:glycosyltransferase involved in cell wall biosynthesis
VRIAILNWRDLSHPEGGGAEVYAIRVAEGLVARGHHVTVLCADHGAAPRDEDHRGVRIRRRGGRLGVYPQALFGLRALTRLDGAFNVVVDVQNGLPFFSPLATRCPVVTLVHHVHREQWPVVFGPLVSRLGWFVESQVAPRLYRGRQYVAVSGRTKDELADLGVDPSHIAVIHNGTAPPLNGGEERSPHPTIVVLGRLVPHKRVEHAVDVVLRLRSRHPGLELRVVGHGWWADRIAAYAAEHDARDSVALLGFVPEDEKHRELARAWLALAPSVKEGWGLSVVEAGSHGVPTVAYHGAGGLSESIEDGRTGLLAHDLASLTEHTDRLLTDHDHRTRLGEAAKVHSTGFTWEATIGSWEDLLTRVVRGNPPVSCVDAGAAFVTDRS